MAERRSIRNFLRSRLFLIGGSVVALFIAFSAARELYVNYETDREIRALEDQSKKLEARRLELLDLTKKLESGEFLEKQARLELGLRKPGESVAVVQPGAASSPNVTNAPQSNPVRWWNYFVRRQ